MFPDSALEQEFVYIVDFCLTTQLYLDFPERNMTKLPLPEYR